jgi:hypothetical protein
VRLAVLHEDRVEYEGELWTPAESWPVRAIVSRSSGAVEVEGKNAPGWLVTLLRSILRAAWRSAEAGTPWPRRLNRWRTGPEREE